MDWWKVYREVKGRAAFAARVRRARRSPKSAGPPGLAGPAARAGADERDHVRGGGGVCGASPRRVGFSLRARRVRSAFHRWSLRRSPRAQPRWSLRPRPPGRGSALGRGSRFCCSRFSSRILPHVALHAFAGSRSSRFCSRRCSRFVAASIIAARRGRPRRGASFRGIVGSSSASCATGTAYRSLVLVRMELRLAFPEYHPVYSTAPGRPMIIHRRRRRQRTRSARGR